MNNSLILEFFDNQLSKRLFLRMGKFITVSVHRNVIFKSRTCGTIFSGSSRFIFNLNMNDSI